MAYSMQLYCETCGAVSMDGKVTGGSNLNGHQHKFKPYQQSSNNNHVSSSSSVTIISSQQQKQVQQKVYPIKQAKLIPFHRYFNGQDHFYTTNAQEIGTTTHGQKGHHGYTYEHIAAYIAAEKRDGYIPLHRYCKYLTEHFYTTNAQEIGTVVYGATGKYGYKYEGIAGWVAGHQVAHSVPLYRYCKYLSEHFYTIAGIEEIGTITYGATGKYGYKCEGIACYVFRNQCTAV
eukprot:357572_1